MSREDITKRKAQAMKEAGIRTWVPRQRSLSMEFCRSYVARFFKCQKQDGGLWQSNQFFHLPLIHVSERLNMILSPLSARSFFPTLFSTFVTLKVLVQVNIWKELPQSWTYFGVYFKLAIYTILKEQCCYLACIFAALINQDLIFDHPILTTFV
jgi:hypothetical protein